MGTAYEQSESISRRNYSKGDNLQLNLAFDDTGDKETEKSLPPFNMDDLPRLLREDVALLHTREEIQQFFLEHTDEQERAEYLESCYDETLVETFRRPEKNDYTHIGYKKSEHHGLDVWHGGYLKPLSSSHFSFFTLQQEVAKLIDLDQYLLPRWDGASAIQMAYEKKVFNKYVDYQLFIYRDDLLRSSSEIIEYFNEHSDDKDRADFIKECYPDHIIEWEVDGVNIGVKKESDNLYVYLGSYEQPDISSRYSWSRVAHEVDSLILSRYFDPNIQIPTAEEQQKALYENEQALQNGIYFSRQEINRLLTRGSGFQDGKYRIYQQFQKNDDLKSFSQFLRKEYGTGGMHPVVGYIDMNHDSKGIHISRQIKARETEIKVTLKWEQAAKYIGELIQDNRYLVLVYI